MSTHMVRQGVEFSQQALERTLPDPCKAFRAAAANNPSIAAGGQEIVAFVEYLDAYPVVLSPSEKNELSKEVNRVFDRHRRTGTYGVMGGIKVDDLGGCSEYHIWNMLNAAFTNKNTPEQNQKLHEIFTQVLSDGFKTILGKTVSDLSPHHEHHDMQLHGHFVGILNQKYSGAENPLDAFLRDVRAQDLSFLSEKHPFKTFNKHLGSLLTAADFVAHHTEKNSEVFHRDAVDIPLTGLVDRLSTGSVRFSLLTPPLKNLKASAERMLLAEGLEPYYKKAAEIVITAFKESGLEAVIAQQEDVTKAGYELIDAATKQAEQWAKDAKARGEDATAARSKGQALLLAANEFINTPPVPKRAIP